MEGNKRPEMERITTPELAEKFIAELETDGTMSVILFPEFRPATARDLGLKPRDTGYPVIIINDGKLMRDNLRIAGRDEVWLRQELKRRGASGPGDVYLLMLDAAGGVYYAPKGAV